MFYTDQLQKNNSLITKCIALSKRKFIHYTECIFETKKKELKKYPILTMRNN